MTNPWIALEDVDVVLGDRLRIHALHRVRLVVREASYVAIMGPSGSGKSTLLHVLGCLRRPTRGSVTVCGVRDPGLKERRILLRSSIGFVFQDFNLLPALTAIENVEEGLIYQLAAPRDRRSVATKALTELGLADRLGHRPSQMSAGQKQRVALARAIAKHPALVLADEPTGSLDSKTGAGVLDVLDSINEQGITIITATHDPAVSRRARAVVRLEDGQIT